jgi:uncharacterized protein YfaS (alpha-2-macroglobulin family)
MTGKRRTILSRSPLWLLRATTAGTFSAAGARVEAMYAPEVTGRSEAVTVTVK